MKNQEMVDGYRKKRGMAERLHCTPRHINDLMLQGLPYYRLSPRKILFSDRDVDAWLAQRRVGGVK